MNDNRSLRMRVAFAISRAGPPLALAIAIMAWACGAVWWLYAAIVVQSAGSFASCLAFHWWPPSTGVLKSTADQR
jgi:hypothetical protein